MSMLYLFRAVSPSIIRSSRTVHTASGMCQACLVLPLAVITNPKCMSVPATKIEEASNKNKFLWEISSKNLVIHIKVYYDRKF